MPEVTPKYVDPLQLLDRPVEGSLVLSGNDTVPVLTLDQIEAWLKGQKTFYQAKARQGFDVRQSCAAMDDLLAQVQAWKEGK